ncbi:MAG: chemotaxis protein CheW [Fischerella sp.]|nr:chemotaxis protein CheW [Fischerella sp.]
MATKLSISQIAEVLTIPIDRVTPIPQLPAWVMGAYNWRGEVLWMVDLAHLLGLTPWHQQGMCATYTAIVLRGRSISISTPDNNAEKQTIGLVINQAEMVEWCDPDLLQSPSSDITTPELILFMRGYQLKPNDKRLAVLDDEAIVAAISQS